MAALVLGAVLGGASPCRADDSFAAVGAGGLVFQRSGSVAMQREDLVLSPRTVRVRYEMRNGARAPVRGHVAFPLPPFPAAHTMLNTGFVPPDARPNFLRFTLKVNGQPHAATPRVWATLGGRDVTAVLARHGLDVRALPIRPDLDAMGLGAATLARLRAAGLVRLDGTAAFARWDTHVAFEWDQVFPPGVTVIEHEYAPLLGGAYDTSARILDGDAARYCIGRAAREVVAAGLRERQGDDPNAMVFLSFLSFVLRTARNWHGPVGHLSVTLEAEHPDDTIALCPHGLRFRPEAPGRLVATATHWTANADIDAVLISLHRPPMPEQP